MAASMRRAQLLTSKTNLLKFGRVNSASVTNTTAQTILKPSEHSSPRKVRVGCPSPSAERCQFFSIATVRRQRHSEPAKLFTCWKCGHEHSGYTMFCEKCRALQEPKPGATHFDVLGVDQRFDINASDLTQKFRRLQSTLHPDKFTQKSQKETSLSEQHSAAVNRAYQTLLKPIPRGLYLLQLHGSDLEEGEIQMDPDFLMEIMEVNETLADCTDWAEIRDIDDKNKVILDELIREVAKHFDAADIRNAKKTLSKLKYYANIDDKVKEKERKQMDAR